MKLKKSLKFCLVLVVSFFPVFANAAGGLDSATNTMQNFRLWAYAALGIACAIYMIYKCVMALLERETWGGVFMGLGYCAISGGIMVGADYCWRIWGSGSAF